MSDPTWHPEAAEAAAAALDAIAALEAGGIKVALGGSLALGLWGFPRGTADADLNVFTGEEGYPDVVSCLERAGFAPTLDRQAWCDEDRRRLVDRMREGQFAAVYRGAVRVDLFAPSIPFYDEAERTLRSFRAAAGRTALALSPEALSVFKLLFFRGKDLVDLRRLVAVQGAALDHGWVRQQLVSMFPSGDERIEAWDDIVRTHAPAPGS